MNERRVLLRPSDAEAHIAFKTTFLACYLQDSFVAHSVYGPAMAISKFDELWTENYFLSMPVAGAIQCDVSGDRLQADAGRYLIYPPNAAQHLQTIEKTGEISIAVRPDYLRVVCARLLGRPVESDIQFTHHMPADAPHAKALRLAAGLCLNHAPDDNSEALQRFGAQLQEFIATTLLYHHAHDLSEELHGSVALPAPRDVKRVIDYIHANLSQPIRLSDLISVANVPGRTLNGHFRRFLGLSPMAYLHRERLSLARRLLSEGTGLSVTDVATACGLFHLGRFSVEYKRAFGENPSETRSRALKDSRV